MAATRYFEEQVLRKRPYLTEALCRTVLTKSERKSVQSDGRVRVWGYIDDPRDGSRRALRVIVLEDGVTIQNAFFDRNFEAP